MRVEERPYRRSHDSLELSRDKRILSIEREKRLHTKDHVIIQRNREIEK